MKGDKITRGRWLKADVWRPVRSGLDRLKMSEHLFVVGVAIVIGLLCGLGAAGFRLLIDAFEIVFWGSAHDLIETLKEMPRWRVVLMPAVGGLLVGGIVTYFASEARGHGVPEVMAAVALRDGIIRVRVALAKAFSSALTIASGGSAGREGPIIQIGSAIGSATGQFLGVSRRRLRTFVGCGAAAGIAATFNAPIAGALFSVEVILGDFGVAQFSPIVISSVTATVVARHFFGAAPVFVAPVYRLVSARELIAYSVLGIVCGLVSAAYIRMLYGVEDFFDARKRISPYIKPALGGLALGIIGLALPQVYGDGRGMVDLALANRLSWGLLLILLVGKMVATSLTLGSGGSGGVFAPSLFLGAMAGGLVGKATAPLLGVACGGAGGYALVGMAGVVAGATHAPITAILIIFEITNNYGIILPLMMVSIVSILVSSRLSRESIYSLKLARRGIDLFRGRSLDVLKNHRVSRCLRREVETVGPDEPIGPILDRMMHGEHDQFYMVDADRILLGVLTLADVRKVLLAKGGLDAVLLASDLARRDVPVCAIDESLSDVLRKFSRVGLAELPVVEGADAPRLVGTVSNADVIHVYHEELMRVDTAESLARRMGGSDAGPVDIVPGFRIAHWDPPAALWDQTLAQADIPARYGVRVVLVKRKAADGMSDEIAPVVPGADYCISKADTLVVFGRAEDVERVKNL